MIPGFSKLQENIRVTPPESLGGNDGYMLRSWDDSSRSLREEVGITEYDFRIRQRGFMSDKRILGYFSELYEFRFVLQQLVRQQLTLRYRRTVFGYLWTLFNPLLMMSVTAVVFSTIIKMDLKTYAIFLFSGMIPFIYFSTSVTQSGQSLIGNEGLIKIFFFFFFFFLFGFSVSFFFVFLFVG